MGNWGRDCWRQKIRVPVLSRGVVSVILRLAVVTQYRRMTGRGTDGRTDRRSDEHTMTTNTRADHAS